MKGRNLEILLACVLCMTTASAIKNLRVLSPLKALTIWDPEVKDEPATARSRFLPVFRARLQAESEARKELKAKKDQELQASASSSGWAQSTAMSDRRRRRAEERYVEEASDRAAAKAAASLVSVKKKAAKNSNNYQFVGVVNPKTSGKPIKWYARPKPSGSKWSVRLVHVDQAAIITDLFRKGEVDIFAKYKNTGKVNPETNLPVIDSEYTVRERSVRNLWNFSPKHFFSDSSGMYWRERRVRPGLYTDGNNVYEATYRYRDGKNGMHRMSTLNRFMASKSISTKQKKTIQKRLKEDSPDLVLEE
ncbi:expressed unknown protein [Seminavis robusta]|uniref:Uncharacterized protein n=1 Tax=Seminavis robusta TaxID=568900 RepID=A0A9N8HBU9_9STRA|nr:expressed unknown protein [Seminavis robusta]|eukprot:Sro196_g083580.1 n/a (306) ;mRNA; r:64244-65279